MISTTTLTRAARVAFQGYLTAAFFKIIVVDRTIEVVSRSEKVSIRLVTSTVCSSTAVLLIATTKAAQQFLNDDLQRVPAHKDVDDAVGPNACFAGGRVADAISTTKAFGAPAQPSSSRAVIESTEPAFDGPTEGLSTIDSDTTLIACDKDSAKDIFSGDCVSDTTDLDSESLADESTLYEDDCQATAQCLTDDEPEHILHAEYDSQTINDPIQRMATLSLDHVPSHLSSLNNVSSLISTISLDDVASHTSILPLDNVPSHISTISLDDVASHISILPLDDVPSHLSSLSLDSVHSHLSTLPPQHILYAHTINTLPDPSQPSELQSTHALNDRTITNLPGTPPDSQSSKCQPRSTQVQDCPIDDLIRRMLDLSLDDAPSQLLTLGPYHALHGRPVDALPNNTKVLALNDSLAINTLPENPDALTLDDNHAIAIDALLQKSAALTLDNHAIAIDALLPMQKLATLTLDDNYDINTLPNNTDALALDGNHAIDAPPQQSEALTLSFDASQSSKLQLQHMLHDDTDDTLLHNTGAFSLDDGSSQSSELQLQSTLDDTIDVLLQKMDALSLDDHPSWSQPRHILYDDTLDDSSPRHLHHKISYTMMPPTPYSEIPNLLLTIVALSPRNFDYDTPYTTMLSTPYFEMWNLLFSTVVPCSRQKFSHNTSY
ncbi:hypothetical protein DFJ58DRAFT_726661 [Suillus subalutaceus]|uniref:uncharacterized protein n=1 Tax=Suillus subalutaceus TaxID=48586 RepID=UPI001B867F82|nr:uncharacterized protein DFJ58DRAFT_726661 [Suillus subalutaceus]KAG1858407.1 hypothetical protein DFJ58DRAFT_726661 [Suillus subalutaceus]